MDLKIRDFEIEILKFLRNTSNSFWDTLFQLITILGESTFVFAIIIFIYFIYDKKIGRKIIFSLSVSLLVNNALKGIVKYVRPFEYDKTLTSLRKETATGYSFPSGHTQTATTFYSSLAHNSEIETKVKISKKVLWLIAIILFSLIGFSRLVLAVHYPKDVIVGIILGLSLMFFASYLFEKFTSKESRLKNELLLNIIILTTFLPFIFIFFKENYSDIILTKDFYTVYSLFLGYTLGVYLDDKFVNFTTKTSLKKRIVRLILGLFSMIFCTFILKYIFPKENILFDSLRYFLGIFSAIGLIPLIFKNSLYKD